MQTINIFFNDVPCPARRKQINLGLHPTAFIGRRKPMATVAPIQIVDVEKVLLSISPRDEDGQIASDAPYGWTSSDPSIISLLPGDDEFSQWAISGVPGVAVVTVRSASDMSDSIQITVVTGVAASLNLSAGSPLHE